MTDKDVLTQDEIDALLSGVDDGTVETDEADDSPEVNEYDLTNQDRVVRGRLPTVELIAERFIRRLRVNLPSQLKIPLEVGTGGVQVIKFSEYTETLYVPTCLKLLRVQPFSGTALMALDAKLVHRLVDRFFGGTGTGDVFEAKEFSPTERKVINRVVDYVLADFTAAWEEVMPINCEVIGDEINPGLVNVIGTSDAVLVTSYRIDLDDSSGELHIVFPYASLEPYKRVLDATGKQDGEDGDGAWQQAIEQLLMDVEIPLTCLIGDSEVRLRKLLRMQSGDVLDLDMNDLHAVSVENQPLFSATLGDSRGRLALEFNEFVGEER